MSQTVAAPPAKKKQPIAERRFLTRFGPFAVGTAALLAVITLLIFADYTPIAPTGRVVGSLFLANLAIIGILLLLMAAEMWRLISARRAHAAGARLHLRIVRLFSIIAAAPAVLIALVGWITLDRSLNPAFMQDVRGFVYNTAEAARLFRESQCRSLLAETRLTALDLSHARQAYDQNHSVFDEFFESRAKFLGFRVAALLKSDGMVLRRVDPKFDERVPPSPAMQAAPPPAAGATADKPDAPAPRPAIIARPESNDFEDARKNEPQCLITDEGRTFVALTAIDNFDDTFLYAARPIDPFAIEFPAQAAGLINLYEVFDAHRLNIQIAFASMFVLIALVMVLSATWLGISFATRLVTPIRRLISATDEVSAGNLYAQVPVQRSDGDLASLGETFNKMTSELRLQQNRLISANQLIDERRMFTEAVLSGVPAAIVGVDGRGRVSAFNPSAERLFGGDAATGGLMGQPIDEAIPELAPILAEAKNARARLYQGQITANRQGRERILNIRITSEQPGQAERSFVVTLDDITDLVSAQRTSAWADVARRIAHEIKNPLTPIQLSAERLKRKYGKLITQDREIFDQCTDTIVRQVDDIKRMVDEFSSFARMPRARPAEDDIAECARQVLFLMRVGHPEVTFEEHIPAEPVIASFDRRLLSQALTNIVKNATEGVSEGEHPDGFSPRVDVSLSVDASDMVSIDIIDNGKGFPSENRSRLLEPYVTSRTDGTGLGLPIVAKILEDHGGGIELLDAPSGQGARVRLFFPRHGREGEPVVVGEKVIGR
jgi:two-component system nitrogen regulation sensor histidine kinase NtrY